jgi:pyruvate kinase
MRGGVLESRKSVALPGIAIQTSAMTGTDLRHIRLAKAYGVTGVMQPFVREKADLQEVRNALNEAGCGDLRLFAKIENAEGVAHLDELIPLCDEIVIARGDLGNAMPLWELPAAQKRIAAVCRKADRDFTVVTQMLDSMTRRPVPTRAEVSDIFNAVLDGARSVMVTGETASGNYPVLAIRYLVKTVREAEAYRNGTR